MKIEKWNDHEIRFVENNGEWWAVAKDVAQALGYRMASDMTRNIDKEEQSTHKVSTSQRRQTIISETGIYEAVFNSKRLEAKEFKKWVKQTIKEIRKSTGLEGFQVFRMLDKEHQKEAMQRLRSNLKEPVRVDFIKANTIANKAVSSKYGHPKMIKKDQMTPEMLVSREPILDDTVDLMGVNERFNLGLKVSETIYNKHIH